MVLQRLKPLLVVSFVSIFLLNTLNLFANEKEAAAKEEGSFNVTQTILEHIKDCLLYTSDAADERIV